ncbi:hypothetical protein BCY88_38465 [Paraburkholderia fungorum]|uniref:Filamentous hemagglutinin n=2 Tax=Paraburkholderia fungorum TaxID=134537 RepID=A0A420FN68_9BURK|nr:hypothetical protein BCY88_38465 [Paraburkholderia fungorum]
MYQTSTTQQAGTSGVISAGNSISLTAGSLSNKDGQITAQGNVTLNVHVQSLGNGAVAPTAAAQTTITADPTQLASLGTIAERGLVTTGIDTAVYGGSFGRAFGNSMIGDLGMVGAGAIGAASTDKSSVFAEGSPGCVLAHADHLRAASGAYQ